MKQEVTRIHKEKGSKGMDKDKD